MATEWMVLFSLVHPPCHSLPLITSAASRLQPGDSVGRFNTIR